MQKPVNTKLHEGLFISQKVLSDPNLTPIEKMVYSQIIYYYNNSDNARCYASNKYLSDKLCIPLATVKRTIKSLISKRYLMTSKYKNNSKKRSILKYDKKTINYYEKGVFEGVFSLDYEK